MIQDSHKDKVYGRTIIIIMAVLIPNLLLLSSCSGRSTPSPSSTICEPDYTNRPPITCTSAPYPTSTPLEYPGTNYYDIRLVKIQTFEETKPGCWKRIIKWTASSMMLSSDSPGDFPHYHETGYPSHYYPTAAQAIEEIVKEEDKENAR